MPAIKFDVSDVDPEQSTAGGGEQPPVGMYVARITASDDENPKDKDRRLHVQYRLVSKSSGDPLDEKYVGLHDYIVFAPSSKWKLDQYLQATGHADSNKRTGSFDPSKDLGKLVLLQVKAESYNGNYQGKAGGVWLYEGDEIDEGALDDGLAGGDEDDRWAEIVAMGDEVETDEDVQAEITAYAEEAGLDPEEYDTWVELVEALEVGEEAAAEEGGDEEPEQDEAWAEFLGMEEDDLAENGDAITEYAEQYDLDPNDYPTWAGLVEAINDLMNGGDGNVDDGETVDYSTWEIKDLKAECEARDLPATGAKSALVKRLTEADAEAGPFD